MKKWNRIYLLLTILIFGTMQLAGKDDYSNFQGRAISLKVLQQQLKDFQSKGSLPTNLYTLCGITTLHGYLPDEANNDIILIGSVDKKMPPLCLDDFVIALRNAWMKYTELKDNTNYYSDPGCSIDPDPAVMGKLDEIAKQFRESSANYQANVLQQWDNVCRSPQKVRVMGVPFNSHFASVMVNADYDMKKIVDGTDELNLLCFSSLSDLLMNEAKTKNLHGRGTSNAIGSMNRFWFYPGEYRFLEDDGAVMIETCKVKLLTEEEHLTANGEISGAGCSNQFAETFVRDFSTFYHEIAAQRPIFQELENLFRFVALAKAMKMKAPHEKVGLSLDYLLERCPVSISRVDNTKPGRSNVNYFKHQKKSAQGTQELQLWLPSCGGVLIDFNECPKDPGLTDGKCILKKTAENVFKDRTSNNQSFWGFGKIDNDSYSSTVLLDPTGAFLNGHIAILLYSPQDGYYYCSHSGFKKDNIVTKIEKGQFENLIGRYQWGFRTEISEANFKKMKNTADKIVGNYYQWRVNNCADFVHFVLMSGKLSPKNRQLIPNIYFISVVKENDGTIILQPSMLWD